MAPAVTALAAAAADEERRTDEEGAPVIAEVAPADDAPVPSGPVLDSGAAANAITMEDLESSSPRCVAIDWKLRLSGETPAMSYTGPTTSEGMKESTYATPEGAASSLMFRRTPSGD